MISIIRAVGLRSIGLVFALVGCVACAAEQSNSEHVSSSRRALTGVTVAAVQYGGSAAAVDSSCSSQPDPDVCAVGKLVEQAHAKGAELVVTPEYGLGQNYLELDPEVGENPSTDTSAQQDAFITVFSKQAAALKIYLVIDLQTYVGEKPNRRLYNTQVAFGPDGNVVGKHHKFELFSGEKKNLTPGVDVSVFDTPFGKVGMLICADMYGDLRLHDKLTGQLGARIVAVSSLWTAGGGYHWPQNFARNWGVYVVSSNTTSGAGKGGGVFAPDGTVLKVDSASQPAISVVSLPKD